MDFALSSDFQAFLAPALLCALLACVAITLGALTATKLANLLCSNEAKRRKQRPWSIRDARDRLSDPYYDLEQEATGHDSLEQFNQPPRKSCRDLRGSVARVEESRSNSAKLTPLESVHSQTPMNHRLDQIELSNLKSVKFERPNLSSLPSRQLGVRILNLLDCIAERKTERRLRIERAIWRELEQGESPENILEALNDARKADIRRQQAGFVPNSKPMMQRARLSEKNLEKLRRIQEEGDPNAYDDLSNVERIQLEPDTISTGEDKKSEVVTRLAMRFQQDFADSEDLIQPWDSVSNVHYTWGVNVQPTWRQQHFPRHEDYFCSGDPVLDRGHPPTFVADDMNSRARSACILARYNC